MLNKRPKTDPCETHAVISNQFIISANHLSTVWVMYGPQIPHIWETFGLPLHVWKMYMSESPMQINKFLKICFNTG